MPTTQAPEGHLLQNPDGEFKLVTFPPSLDSELARFVLTLHGLKPPESRHTLIFSSVVTMWRGASINFPLLYCKSAKLSAVRDIIYFLESQASPETALFPAGKAERERLRADWIRFYKGLGVATANWAYYNLIRHRSLLVGPLSEGTPWFERWSVKLAYPLFAYLLKSGLKLTEENAKSSLEVIQKTFGEVDEFLSDGRQYLVGDRLTLSDVLFAVSAAPLLLPEKYGGAIPKFSEIPPEYRELSTELRERAAGKFGLRIYAEYRDRRPVANR